MNLDFLTLDSWVTADHHWEHPNIRLYQNRPENHFEIMRARWIDRVLFDDIVLHLGDLVCFGDRKRHPFWIDGLPGQKYLIRGNHDKHSDQWYSAAGFKVLGRKPLYWHRYDKGKIVCFSHEPETQTGGWDINVHGHLHLNDYWLDPRRLQDRRNVCVERTGYAPVRLREVLEG